MRLGSGELDDKILAFVKERKRATEPTINATISECSGVSGSIVKSGIEALARKGKLISEQHDGGFPVYSVRRR